MYCRPDAPATQHLESAALALHRSDRPPDGPGARRARSVTYNSIGLDRPSSRRDRLLPARPCRPRLSVVRLLAVRHRPHCRSADGARRVVKGGGAARTVGRADGLVRSPLLAVLRRRQLVCCVVQGRVPGHLGGPRVLLKESHRSRARARCCVTRTVPATRHTLRPRARATRRSTSGTDSAPRHPSPSRAATVADVARPSLTQPHPARRAPPAGFGALSFLAGVPRLISTIALSVAAQSKPTQGADPGRDVRRWLATVLRHLYLARERKCLELWWEHSTLAAAHAGQPPE
jgi:hypothetical protein